MAEGSVHTVFTSDDKQMARAMAQQIKDMDTWKQKTADLQKKMQEMSKEHRRAMADAQKDSGGFFDMFGAGTESVITQLAGVVTGAVGVAAAIRAITAEITNLKAVAAESASRQITVAGAQQELIRNMAGMSPADVNRTLAAAGKISSKTSVREQDVLSGLAKAMSATGGNVSAAISATQYAAAYLPDIPQDIGGFAGSIADVGRITGYGAAEANAGVLAKIGAISRIQNARDISQSVPKALIDMVTEGSTVAEAGSIFSAISTATGDTTGDRSKTIASGLGRSLSAFMPETKSPLTGQSIGGGAGVFAGMMGGLLADRTTMERIALLQANPAMAVKFLRDGSFGEGGAGTIKSLIGDPNSNIAQQARANLAGFPKTEGEFSALGLSVIDARAMAPMEPVARAARAIDSAEDQAYRSDIYKGIAGISMDGIRRILKSTGATDIEQKLGGMGFDLETGFGSRNAFDSLEKRIGARAKTLASPEPELAYGAEGPISTGRWIQPTQTELKDAGILRELVAILVELKRDSSKLVENTNRNAMASVSAGLNSVGMAL